MVAGYLTGGDSSTHPLWGETQERGLGAAGEPISPGNLAALLDWSSQASENALGRDQQNGSIPAQDEVSQRTDLVNSQGLV